MNITFKNPAEAFAGIAALVISADKVGTLEEKKYLFNEVKGMDIFHDYSDDDFVEIVKKTNKMAYNMMPPDDSFIDQEIIAEFCSAIKEVLSEVHFEKAYSMACEIACSDGLVESEHMVLNQVHIELGMDSNLAMEILNRARQ